MEVVLVQPFGHLPGHYSVYTHRLAAALLLEGCPVRLISQRGFLGGWEKELPLVHEAVAEADSSAWQQRLLPARMKRNKWLASSLQRAFQVGAEDRSRTVHFMDYNPLPLAVFNRRYKRPSYVLTLGALFHWKRYPDDNSLRRFYRNQLWTPSVKDVLRNMFAVTHAYRVAELAVGSGLLRDGMYTVIPSGMEPTNPPMTKRDARRRLGLPEDQVLVLAFGPQRKGKGLEYLVEALGKLDRGRVHLLIAGPADAACDPQSSAVAAGCEEDVTIHSFYVPDERVGTYFSAADLVALAYLSGFESESGVFLHACEYGVPVVASRHGELGRLVAQSSAGLLCASESTDSIARALRSFLGLSEGERADLNARARAFSMTRSWTDVAREHIALYEKVARRRKSRVNARPK